MKVQVVFHLIMATTMLIFALGINQLQNENAKLQSQVNEFTELIQKYDNILSINKETISYQKATISVLEKTLIVNHIEAIPLDSIEINGINGSEHIGYIISKDFRQSK